MRLRKIVIPVVAAATFCGAASLPAAIIVGNAADFDVRENDPQGGNTAATLRAGSSNTAPAGGRAGIFVFDVSSFVGTLSSADLQLTLSTLSGAPAYNADVYGVGYSTASTIVPAGADYYEGAFGSDTTNATNLLGIQNDFVPASTPAANTPFSTDATGDGNLVTFINARPSGSDFVWFRINPDANSGTGISGYNFHSGDATGGNVGFRPQLGLNEQVPEPASLGLIGLGALGLLTRRRRA